MSMTNTTTAVTTTTTTTKAAFYNPMHILDDIHGYIEIPQKIKAIVDTPQFQRLRNLKQLGASYFVFPGASHNRFEHSLGVMHLASIFMQHLKAHQPELGITDSLMFCVSAAGLLHDIGHGPFSHVFDHEFIPSVSPAAAAASHTTTNHGSISNSSQFQTESECESESDSKSESKSSEFESAQTQTEAKPFRHEDMSVKLIQNLFAENAIEIRDDELLLIQALVSPSTHKAIQVEYRERRGLGFIFEIIANDISGIDVDKWDYMLRDSRNCNLGISFNYERLLQHSRVIADHICYIDKTSYELYLLFRTRYELFKRVYCHKTSKSIEYMICDIMNYANDIFRITDKIHDCQQFCGLTDHILTAIQTYPIPAWFQASQSQSPSQSQSESQSESESESQSKAVAQRQLSGEQQPQQQQRDRNALRNLVKAQKLIRRIQCRDLYKCVGYLLLSPKSVAENSSFKPGKTNSQQMEEHSSRDGYETPPTTTATAAEKRGAFSGGSDTSSNASEVEHIAKSINYRAVAQLWRDRIFEIIQQEFTNTIHENDGNTDDNTNDNHDIDDNDETKSTTTTTTTTTPSLSLSKDDLVIQLMSLGYGMEDKHPIEQVFLYSAADPNKCWKVKCDQITTLSDSKKFMEIIFRMFVKDINWLPICKKAFEKFVLDTGLMRRNNKYGERHSAFSLGVSPLTTKASNGANKMTRKQINSYRRGKNKRLLSNNKKSAQNNNNNNNNNNIENIEHNNNSNSNIRNHRNLALKRKRDSISAAVADDCSHDGEDASSSILIKPPQKKQKVQIQ